MLGAIGQLAALHHERMDGSGYPSGLTAAALPMAARVIAAADVYHALLEPRPHRAALSDGAPQIVERIRSWFGGAEEFEVLVGTVGEVGGRIHVAWRLRMHPTPWGDETWHVIEQQVYLHTGDRIDAIDLLCSGFQPEPRT